MKLNVVEFPGGGGGGEGEGLQNKKTFQNLSWGGGGGGSMDIFWKLLTLIF